VPASFRSTIHCAISSGILVVASTQSSTKGLETKSMAFFVSHEQPYWGPRLPCAVSSVYGSWGFALSLLGVLSVLLERGNVLLSEGRRQLLDDEAS